jgi:ABC-type uncharacterized transport system ATPase subunit
MRRIIKSFPGVLANDRVSLEVEQGEIHALLGENGAGKTTLMNILYGLYEPDDGQIILKGKPVKIRSPRDAISLKIGMVHQHFMLIPALTVVENVVLGIPSTKGLLLDLDVAAQKLESLSRRYGLDIRPYARVDDLSVGEQQRAEIVKTLYRGADLLILDEPTAVLTPQEVKGLGETLRGLTCEGKTVIFITHKLKEVMEYCDRVTVLRGGRAVGTRPVSETTPEHLARMMVGHDVKLEVTKRAHSQRTKTLTVQGLNTVDNIGVERVKGVSFSVHAGEILGIAGVDGNGQVELVRAITGLERPLAGQIIFDGVDVTGWPTRRLIEAGLCHIPQDRREDGLIMGMSITENMILETFNEPPLLRRGFLDWKKASTITKSLMHEFDVRAPNERTLARLLSGGNQQKVVLARELSRKPRLIVAMHPTRGLDVGATNFVHEQLLKARQDGAAVLLISTELDEILALSDRIAIMSGGEVTGILRPEDATLEKIGLLMAGERLASAG